MSEVRNHGTPWTLGPGQPFKCVDALWTTKKKKKKKSLMSDVALTVQGLAASN